MVFKREKRNLVAKDKWKRENETKFSSAESERGAKEKHERKSIFQQIFPSNADPLVCEVEFLVHYILS